MGSKAYPADIYCIKSSNSTIIVTTFDVYRSYRLLPDKRACLMVVATLITVIALTTVASHTHCHLKPPFKKKEESLTPTALSLPSKELLACSTCTYFTVRLRVVKSKKTCQLFPLDWEIPLVLADTIHPTNHLLMGAYNPLNPQNSTSIQPVIHA